MSLIRIVQCCYMADMNDAIARDTPRGGVIVYIRRDLPKAEKRLVLRDALRKERVNPVRREVAVLGATAWWPQAGLRWRLRGVTAALVSVAAVTAGVAVAFSTATVQPHPSGAQRPVVTLPHPVPNPVPVVTPSHRVRSGTVRPTPSRTVGFDEPTPATTPAQGETPPMRHPRSVPVSSTGSKPDIQTVVPANVTQSTGTGSRSLPVTLCVTVAVVGVCVRA